MAVRGAQHPIRTDSMALQLAALAAAAMDDPARAMSLLVDLHREVSVAAAALNSRLLRSALQWNDADKAEAVAMDAVHHRLADIACGLARSLADFGPPGDPQVGLAAALALCSLGDAAKYDVAVGRTGPHDYAAMHFLIRLAITGSFHRETMDLEIEGRPARCTVEALYFRALLLARFAGGTLNCKQLEILDGWIWMWMPVLKSTAQPPAGAALRADLDSTTGLTRGPRGEAGPSLYLPQGPIEDAYRAVVAELHNGRIVPAGRLAATFRIEDHVAVLDLIRRGLRESRNEPITRAARRPASRIVEMHVGVSEVMARAFSPPAPVPAGISLATRAGKRVEAPRRESEHDVALREIYTPVRRQVRVVDESDTGLGLEGNKADCGQVCAGDLVGMRLREDGPLVLGRVARIIPGRHAAVSIGVHRLTSASRPMDVLPIDEAGEGHALLYVPGLEPSGTDDGFLVSDAVFTKGGRIGVAVESMCYTLRFNRVRERGRGWVLAGFEVTDVATREACADTAIA